MARSSRYRRRKRTWLGDILTNPKHQMVMTIVAAVLFSGFVFTGLLLFRYSAQEDLLAEGKRMMKEQKVAYAKTTLTKLVNRYPKSYHGHLLLGKAYLALDERKKAENEFRFAASLKSRDTKSGLAEIAMGELAIAKQQYAEAERLLLSQVKKTKHPSEDLKQALYELYNTWGDDLVNEDPEAEDVGNKDTKKKTGKETKQPKKEETHRDAKIIKIYERAVKYAQNFDEERRVVDKLTDLIDKRVETLNKNKKYEESIALLEKSVELRKKPETLIKVAFAYEQLSNTDKAIEWYRKVYSARPDMVSIQLSNMLMQKAQKLKKEGNKKGSNSLISEAEAIVRRAKLPLSELYPVAVSAVSITSDLDPDTGQMTPKVKVTLKNEGQRALSFLEVKAEFLTGDELLTDVVKTVASEKDPLGAEGEKRQKATLTLVPKTKLNRHLLKNDQLMVKILLAYNEGSLQEWKVKAIQEAVIKDDTELLEEGEDLAPLSQDVVPLPGLN